MKKGILITAIFISLTTLLAADLYNIDYYGVFSEDLDENMIVMTSDLYWSQLMGIQDFSVEDQRESSFDINDASSLSAYNYSFYSVVRKKENSSKWEATFNLVSNALNTKFSATKDYDSYYKILMDTKTSLQETLLSLLEANGSSQPEPLLPSASKAPVSTEELAGTWGGEENVNKIIIMRGGRGFVIFKNGASMNINVEINGSTVTVSQNGKANASFFPEIPRNIAMNLALTADPITWQLTLNADDTLSGKKKTLVPTADGASPGFVDVSWHKIN